MGWCNGNGKHFGFVCATHDKMLGRTHLTEMGMKLYDTILFERYLSETVNDSNPVDWPKWLKMLANPANPSNLKGDGLGALNLHSETLGALNRHGIYTLEDLRDVTSDELSKIRMLGPCRVHEIKEKLAESDVAQ